jgi:hypothetical protein
VQLFPWAIVSLIVYVFGFPAGSTYLLYKYRDQVREDQVLRAHGYGDSRKTNPNCYVVR